jgi:hypothetical protein
MTAVMSMYSAYKSFGLIILLIASTRSQRVKVNKKIIEHIVPIISALCHPKVSSFDAGLKVIFKAKIDILNPTKSDAKWAVSAKIAMEPE